MKLDTTPNIIACLCLATGTLVIYLKLNSSDSLENQSPPPPVQKVVENPQDHTPLASDPQPATKFRVQYNSLREMNNGPEKVAAIAQLFEDWGEAEGESAFQFAQTLTGRDHLNNLAAAAAGWARVAPQEAWGAMMQVSNQGLMLERQVGQVIVSIAREDEILATDLLLEIGSQYNRTRLFDNLVGQLKTDTERSTVLDTLLKTNVEGSEFLVQALFRNWGRYDSTAPLARLESIDDPNLSEQAMTGILKGWASVDGQGAFDYVLDSGDPQLIKNALGPIAKEWALASTADELKNLIRTVSQLETADSVLKGLIPTLARANPQLALESIASFENETARANHTRDALSQWAIADLDQAEAYFEAMPPGREKEFAIWGLFNPAIQHRVPVERIMGHVDSLGTPEAIGRALYSMSEYTLSVDRGQQTEDLASAIENHLSQHAELSDEMRQRIVDNLNKRDG